MKGIVNFVKEHSSTFLCVIATGGVIATAVLAVKETPKAIEILEQKKDEELTVKDKIVTVAPVYAPAAVTGILTVACIFGANVLNKKHQASITSAYALLNSTYKRYSGKLKELYGNEAHENIMTSIAAEQSKDICIYAECCGSNTELGFHNVQEEELLCYDAFSDRYFKSTLRQIITAEYHVNRNFALGADISLNDFYEFLGISAVDGGGDIGWFHGCDYDWIDFENYPATLEDGITCHVVNAVFPPDTFE